MAKVTIRKDQLDQVMKVAMRAAGRKNSVVVLAEERLEIENDSKESDSSADQSALLAQFN